MIFVQRNNTWTFTSILLQKKKKKNTWPQWPSRELSFSLSISISIFTNGPEEYSPFSAVFITSGQVSIIKYFNWLLSCCTLPVTSKHKPFGRTLSRCLPFTGFVLGPGSMKIGCIARVGFGFIRFISLSLSSCGRNILFSDSSSETSSWFTNTCKTIYCAN